MKHVTFNQPLRKQKTNTDLKNVAKGFSLIELMIAIAIIAILAAIGVPSYQAQMKKGRASTVKGDLLNLAANVEIYKQGNFSYTGATAANLYSAASPKGAATPDFILEVQVINGGRSYTLSAEANPANATSKDDGDYWFNPTGKNCYFPNGGGPDPDCNGGYEW